MSWFDIVLVIIFIASVALMIIHEVRKAKKDKFNKDDLNNNNG
jgi:hypothetical protein